MKKTVKISSIKCLAILGCLLVFTGINHAFAQCVGKEYHICTNSAADTAKLKVGGHSFVANESVIWNRFDTIAGQFIEVKRDTAAVDSVLLVPVDSLLVHNLTGHDTIKYFYNIVRDSLVTRPVPNMPTAPADVALNYYSFINAGVKFKVTKPMTLNSVTVYTLTDGAPNDTLKITLQDTSGTAIDSFKIGLASVAQKDTIVAQLDFKISDTTKTYQLVAKGSKLASIRRNTSASYPYGTGQLLAINGPTINPSDHYYFFYDWTVKYDSLIPVCNDTVNLVVLTDRMVQRLLDTTGTGRDTICSGTIKALNAAIPGYTNASYAWLDGVTDSVDNAFNTKYFEVTNTLHLNDDGYLHDCPLSGHLKIDLYPVFNIVVDSLHFSDCQAQLDSSNKLGVFASIDDSVQGAFQFLWSVNGAAVKTDTSIGTTSPSHYASAVDSIMGNDTTLSLTVTDLNKGCSVVNNHLIPAGLQQLKVDSALHLRVPVCSGNQFTPIQLQVTGGFDQISYYWDSIAGNNGIVDRTSPSQPHLYIGYFPFTVSDKSNCPARDTIWVLPRYGATSLGHDSAGFNTYASNDSTIWSAITIFDKNDLDTLYDNYNMYGLSLAINHDTNTIWGSVAVRVREGIKTDGNTITDLGRTVFETNLITFDDYYSPFSCLGVPNLELDKDSTYGVEVQITPYRSYTILGIDTTPTVTNKGAWLINRFSPNGRQFTRGNWNIRATFRSKSLVGIDNLVPTGDGQFLTTFPNPANNNVKIVFDNDEQQAINLYVTDLMGKKVAQLMSDQQVEQGRQQVQFNTANLSSGVYLVVLQSQQGVTSHKMVLIK